MAGPTPFKDHFSGQAAAYERYRTGYPKELFGFLAAVSPGRGRALDVGSGNGQAALGLANFFEEVVATEPSRAQLDRARQTLAASAELGALERHGIAQSRHCSALRQLHLLAG